MSLEDKKILKQSNVNFLDISNDILHNIIELTLYGSNLNQIKNIILTCNDFKYIIYNYFKVLYLNEFKVILFNKSEPSIFECNYYKLQIFNRQYSELVYYFTKKSYYTNNGKPRYISKYSIRIGLPRYFKNSCDYDYDDNRIVLTYYLKKFCDNDEDG